MYKAILASVILGSMSVASAADVNWSGDFGYRSDSLEIGNSNSDRDRFRVGLVAKADVNDKTKVVVGVRTGSAKSSWNDMAGGSLKAIDLNLAYVEYAAAKNVKVTLGKMNQPWVMEGLMFDGDIKPEGLAVALKNDSGLSASAFKLKLVENASDKDSTLVGVQVGLAKKFADVDVAAHAGLLNQEINTKATLCYIVYPLSVSGGASVPSLPVCSSTEKYKQMVLSLSATKKVGDVPVKLFVQQLKNDEAKKDDTALAYGVRLGNVKKAGDWEVSLMKQDAEANALSAVWTDSDFGGEATLHDGTALRAAYGLADGWAVRGSYFDVEVGAAKVDYKRLMIDLVYTF
jgi:hypothetical protein